MTTMIETQNKEIENFKQLANIAIKSGKYPAELNEITMLNIMLSARDLGVSPMKAVNGGFYVVNGKISMSTALMSDRIRKEGHSIRITDWNAEKCSIIGIRKDNGDSVKVEYTMEDARLAGLIGSPTWKKYPKNMLYNRAMSTLARVLFSDVVGNCYSEDEKEDIEKGFKKVETVEVKNEELHFGPGPQLTEDQCAQLDGLLCDSEEAQKKAMKICEYLKIDSIYNLPLDQFDRTIKALEKAKGEANAEATMA